MYFERVLRLSFGLREIISNLSSERPTHGDLWHLLQFNRSRRYTIDDTLDFVSQWVKTAALGKREQLFRQPECFTELFSSHRKLQCFVHDMRALLRQPQNKVESHQRLNNNQCGRHNFLVVLPFLSQRQNVQQIRVFLSVAPEYVGGVLGCVKFSF